MRWPVVGATVVASLVALYLRALVRRRERITVAPVHQTEDFETIRWDPYLDKLVISAK